MTYKVFNPQNITVFCGAFVFSPYKSRMFSDSSLSAEQIDLFILANRDKILMVQYINDAPTFVNSVFGRIGNAIAQTGDYSWAQITGKPTTLEGYGITDGVTPEEVTQLAISLSEMAVPDGVATLDSTGKLTADQLPPGVTTGGVISVASLTGIITRVQLLTALQLDQVDNTSDANKPLSQAEQAALGLKVDSSALGSAAFVSSTVFATAAQGALATTAVQPSGLATVAFTGSYSDLSGKPVFATIATTGEYSDLVGAPILSAVALSGSYLDLTNRPSLSAVAISGNYSDLNGRPTLAVVATSGNYSDLTGKPVLALVATTGSYTDLINLPTLGTAASHAATDFATSAQGTLASSAVQPGSLATVATTGSYTDLLNKPTLGTIASHNTIEFATSAQGALATTAVQPGSLAVVATTGSYNDLLNKPTLGTVASHNITEFATAAQGTLASTAVQPASLATVATSGNYSDLHGLPSLFTNPMTSAGDLIVGGSSGSPTRLGSGSTIGAALMVSSIGVLAWTLLASVATSGAYTDLSGRPVLSTVATSGSYTDLINRPSLATVATSGSYSDLSGKPDLATVSSTGSYTDLLKTPTLYSNPMTTAGDLVVGSTGGAASRLAIGANGSALMVSSGTVGWTLLATVATTGSYNSLSNLPALGGAAFLNVGTTAGTVAAGNDSRIVGALQITNALSDLVSYTVATLPTASSNTRHFAYVTDLYGGAEFAYCDGTNWRRLSDRSVVN